MFGRASLILPDSQFHGARGSSAFHFRTTFLLPIFSSLPSSSFIFILFNKIHHSLKKNKYNMYPRVYIKEETYRPSAHGESLKSICRLSFANWWPNLKDIYSFSKCPTKVRMLATFFFDLLQSTSTSIAFSLAYLLQLNFVVAIIGGIPSHQSFCNSTKLGIIINSFCKVVIAFHLIIYIYIYIHVQPSGNPHLLYGAPRLGYGGGGLCPLSHLSYDV